MMNKCFNLRMDGLNIQEPDGLTDNKRLIYGQMVYYIDNGPGTKQ